MWRSRRCRSRLTLADEVDVSRGDLLATGPVQVGRSVAAQVVWMDERPLEPGRVYLLKHAARIVTAEVDTALGLNEIGLVTVTASRPLVFDAYEGNRATGSFLLIDPATNATAGAGLIERAVRERSGRDGLSGADAATRLVHAARAGDERRRGDPCRAPRARGDPDVSDPRALIADELAAASAPCVTSSFQADCVVLVHMLRAVRPDIPVLFLDTVHHFEETYAYRDEIAARWDLNLVTLRADEPSPGLWQQSTEACCARHKVGPLFAALGGYDTWFTGLRREQSPSRAEAGGSRAVHNCPTARSSARSARSPHGPIADVWAYAKAHDIPLLPLYDRGYTSIGCEPCTSLPIDPTNERSGRWGGQKLECGIHIQARS